MSTDLAVLGELCPFFLVLDQHLAVVDTGAALARILPSLADRPPLGEAFAVLKPRRSETFAQLRTEGCGPLARLESRARPELTLRGQFVPLPPATPDGDERLLFFGVPAATTLHDLVALGLTLHDFPPYLGVTDYLLVVQTQATTIIEAKEVAEEMRQLNAALEQRVSQRTRRLKASNARLERYSSELEKMSAQLRHEMAERSRMETERARMEEDLRLAHKLEAVGQLAAGVAHEINTPVQFITDNLHFLKTSVTELSEVIRTQRLLTTALAGEQLDDGPAALLEQLQEQCTTTDVDFLQQELPLAVTEALEGIQRVSRIVRAMKEFAHPDDNAQVMADVNHCVETTLVVSRPEFQEVADLEVHLDPLLPRVRCIPGEINQVVLNLVVNAAHAIRDRRRADLRRGTIRVITRREGDEVVIAVRDDGTGIPSKIQNRIFDPFFTTRDVGHGLGQGLNMCRSIVATRHGGRLEFSTELGVGTEFFVHLPITGLTQPTASAQPTTSAQPTPSAQPSADSAEH